MSQLRLLPPLLIIITIFNTMHKVEPSFTRPSPNKVVYLQSSCKSTRYPNLCVKYLSLFINKNDDLHNPQKLAQVSLTVSLYRGLYTSAYLKKVAKELKKMKSKEYQMVQDCADQINDGVDQLTQSIKELVRLKDEETVSEKSLWHVNNVETWLSAALTDASSCVDQFPVRNMSKLKATVKGKVLNMVQVTSNALAFFHRYAARYGATKP